MLVLGVGIGASSRQSAYAEGKQMYVCNGRKVWISANKTRVFEDIQKPVKKSWDFLMRE